MDFCGICETTSKTIRKTCAKFHFVELFLVIMTVDLTSIKSVQSVKTTIYNGDQILS